jgi:hypothetical protein
MKFNNSNITVYKDDVAAYIINIGEILNKFKCNQITNEEYSLIDDVYIPTLTADNKLSYSRINKIFRKNSAEGLSYININDDINFLSNILCFNNKQRVFFNHAADNLDKKFAVQYNSDTSIAIIDKIDNIPLDMDLGYLVGYWLLRGGFFKLDKHNKEFPSWSGREEDINKLKNILKDQTNLIKSFKDNLQLLLLLEHQFNDFFRNNFISNSEKINSVKKLPDWLLMAKQEFLQGIFYGLVAANSYISNDSKGNFYLAIKITNLNIINLIHDLFKSKFGIYSRIIGDNNHLSFKINSKIYEFIQIGMNKKYITIEDFEDVIPIMTKEILFDEFKIIPWYKFKSNIYNVAMNVSYSLELSNGDSVIKLSNGLFTEC